MAYEKTNWKNGDVITQEKINKIEQGIENAENNGGIVYISVEASRPSDTIVVESSEKKFF